MWAWARGGRAKRFSACGQQGSARAHTAQAVPPSPPPPPQPPPLPNSTQQHSPTQPNSPMPMMWLDECCSPSAHSVWPSQRSVVSRGMVEIRAS